MDSLFFILFIIGIIYLMVWVIKLIIRSAINAPTWSGIIISAILGMLPLYLILCFFGIMGEKRDQSSNGTQSPIGNYAEELSRRYAYEKSSKKNKNWINYAVLAFVVVFLFFIFKANKSEEQGTTIPVETFVSENEALEEPKEETSQIPSEIEIPHKENVDGKTDKKQKSTLELLEERNHASVVKQAKEAGVSTEGSTLDILERINHANVVKQAKEAGVSTEGSTLDILERINRKALEDYLK